MGSGILGVALSGLSAAQAGIATAEHNISNANTVGYRRQEVTFSALSPQYTGSGYFGTGVGVDTVRSIYSQFLDSEVRLNQSQLSRNQTYTSYASQVDSLLGSDSSSLNTALDSFFAAVNELANDPTSNAARQVLLSSANTLAGQANTLYTQLQGYITASNAEVSGLTSQINTYTGQIAQLNGDIAKAEAGGGGTANDLRDQRDQLIGELNKLVDVSVVEQSDGTLNLFVGSGQSLVVGTNAYTMSTTTDPNDSSLLIPTLNVGGTVVTLDTGLITGGQLGGVLAVREEVIQPAQEDLDRITLSFATEFNALHTAGLDLNLAAGGDFFTNPVTGAAGNSGVLTLSLGNDLNLQNSDYSLTYDGTNYTLTRLSDGTAFTGGLAAVTASEGFSLSLGTTTAAAGDSWTINLKGYAGDMAALITDTSKIAAAGATADGPGDNSNALALAALQTQSFLNNGTVTFSSAYAQTVSRTASLAAEADLNVQTFSSLTDLATAAQQNVSGVNLDEEAVNLVRFQQAYQAAARALQVASSLFDDLLGVLG
ncbi:MAG TPA: flagellar hook-associated protein FlgK [Thiobacillaceae bacterium]|nr:flagellar hook-associated protein FlgK [Thiobacillaceae bacterium]HNF87929.1 flagellar hook-associated protein FlgK [Thiobacillaceae bacterium]HNH88170.1 flagellar hook-associated protein FlgK [Thiobacillaceae bacterium]